MTEEPPANRFFGPPVNLSRSDVRPVLRAELVALREELVAGIDQGTDPMTRIHTEDLVVRIDDLLGTDPGG
jgi:hypothetical protein